MTDPARSLCRAMRAELVEHLLPYWEQHTVDAAYGGFVGRITSDGQVISRADKGAILNTRLLWTFSAAYRVLGQENYRVLADRAYGYIEQFFRDSVYDGLYWMLDYTGQPIEDKKQVYAQAFAIYAYSEYFRATHYAPSRERAIALWRLLEHHHDTEQGGYYEGFSRAWGRLRDMRLSDKDQNVPKGMNTHLHVLEAYTNLYRIWPDPALRASLTNVVRLFLDHIIDSSTHHMRLYFTGDWTPLDATISFGHDIEASWLLHEASEVLGDTALHKEVLQCVLLLAQQTLNHGFDDDGGLFNEQESSGHLDTDKHWWPQAEAIVGCLNAYHLTRDPAFLDQARQTWHFIQAHLIDRQHGEWFWGVSREGVPIHEEDKVGPWKGPYHNVRACLEIMERVTSYTSANGMKA